MGRGKTLHSKKQPFYGFEKGGVNSILDQKRREALVPKKKNLFLSNSPASPGGVSARK